MKYYQELTLLPDYEMSISFLWSKLYQKLHMLLVTNKNARNGNVGVSFPQYLKCSNGYPLGDKIRLFSETREELADIDLKSAFEVYSDYLHITSIRKVPESCNKYLVYKRYHVENGREQKAKRYAARHKISFEKALELFPKDCHDCTLPYIQLRSCTNANKFRLYIQRLESPTEKTGIFNAYGLSNEASVPDF